ncbi:MAG: nitroreductase family protein [Clostridiales bacterium]|nr:nitroreductase family protein [Clostridiales bacterium]
MNEIYIRRSVRLYTDKFIEEEKIEQILKAGMQAPSAGNQHPWEFIVVNDKEILEKLSVASINAGCTDKAPVAIVLLVNHNNLRFPEYTDQDMSACAQNILLEAVSLGLGAVWLGIAPLKDREKAISDIFDLPDNIQPFAIIPIGYPLNEGANQFIDRYDPKKVTFY